MKKTKQFRILLVVALITVSASLFAQVKIGTNPTVISPNNNLEVESSTPGNKVSIDKTTGKMTYQDGTQGNLKILTSDANGVASWATSLRIPETVWIGQLTSQYNVTTFNGNYNELQYRLPLTPRSGSLTGWDAVTKQYTIQESGYYRIHIGASIFGSVAGSLPNNSIRIYL
jgi:hypothetical protein